MKDEIRKELDLAVLETLETVNNDDANPQEIGAAIQASEILSRTRNELMRTEAEVKKIEAEAKKIEDETELAKLSYEQDKKHYWIDHLITGAGLVTVLHYEQANIIGSKLFSNVWSTFSKGFANTARYLKRK